MANNCSVDRLDYFDHDENDLVNQSMNQIQKHTAQDLCLKGLLSTLNFDSF